MNKFYKFAKPHPNVQKILDINVHSVDEDDLHEYMKGLVQRKETAHILNVNVHCMNLAVESDFLKDFLNDAQVVFCDGDGVRWGMKLLGLNPPPKVPFTRWIWSLSEFCEKEGFSLYFLGGEPGVTELAKEKLTAKYPTLKVVGTDHGYFRKIGPESDEAIARINAAEPDFLIIGFGMPIQERWIYQNSYKIKTHAFLPAGAVFDYASGKLGEAPEWILKLQCEWMFRVYEEPGRLFMRYFRDLPKFFFRVFLEKFFGRK